MNEKISTAFIQRAAEVVSEGLTGSQIVSVTTAFAVDFDCDVPYAEYPFTGVSKKTALFENLKNFNSGQQYQVISELVDRVSTNPVSTTEQKLNASKIKTSLLLNYFQFGQDNLSNTKLPLVVTEVRHWLSDFSGAKKAYEDALQKHSSGVFTRNVLDDLRLSLEMLLRQLLENEKSLENQLSAIGEFVKVRGGSTELSNMLVKLVDYYTKFQNTYVKHGDAVPSSEAEFVLEITACFMKHFIRIQKLNKN